MHATQLVRKAEPSGWLESQIAGWLEFRVEVSRGEIDDDYRAFVESIRETNYRADSILRIAEVLRRTGLSRSALWRRIAVGQFPRPIKLGAIRQAA